MSNPYRISRQGYGVASFAGGGEFLFDLADLPLIQRHTWHQGKRGYPATHTLRGTVVLHRLLFPDMDGYEIDHINGDKLDNRRANLRACTHQQNGFNQKRRTDQHQRLHRRELPSPTRLLMRHTSIIMGRSTTWVCTPIRLPPRGCAIASHGSCSASTPA